MKAEHTPGPWSLYLNKRDDFAIRKMSDSGYEPNARLIASAPDLLSSLIEVRDNARDDSPEMCTRIDSAIAKATGEE